MGRHFVNLHMGETGIIAGNGPSLNDVPLCFLRKYPSFGTNWCFLHPTWTPTYYVAVDPSNNRGDYINHVNEMKSVKFIGEKIIGKMGAWRVSKAIMLSTRGNKHEIPFSYNPFMDDLWEGWSVTYVALQLAYFMGFKTILLVGVDHRYTCGMDNHFHPDYETGSVWVEHDMTKALPAYEMAEEIYRKEGRKIVNLTPGSDLHTFEMGDIRQWM